MRAIGFALWALIGMSCALPAGAAPAGREPALAAGSAIVNIAGGCGRGYHWVPPGYARHGKWRGGHCAPN